MEVTSFAVQFVPSSHGAVMIGLLPADAAVAVFVFAGIAVSAQVKSLAVR